MQPSHTRRCHDNRTDMCCVPVSVKVCVCEYACVRVGGALNRKPSLAVKEHFIRLIKTTNSIEQQ